MELKEKVDKIIEEIRPALQADGGGIDLIEVLETEQAVVVELTGACKGCPMSTYTIKNFVEKKILEAIPEIKEVRVAQ